MCGFEWDVLKETKWIKGLIENNRKRNLSFTYTVEFKDENNNESSFNFDYLEIKEGKVEFYKYNKMETDMMENNLSIENMSKLRLVPLNELVIREYVSEIIKFEQIESYCCKNNMQL